MTASTEVLKPGSVACSASSVRSSIPAPASSTNEAAICTTANARSLRVVEPVIRTPPLDRPNPCEASDEGRRGTKARSRAARTARTTPTQSRVESSVELERADREARGVVRQHVDHRTGNHDADHRAGHTEDQAFGKERAPQSGRAGAERRAHGQLGLAADAAGENEVRHVRARDDEDERRDAASSTSSTVRARDVI